MHTHPEPLEARIAPAQMYVLLPGNTLGSFDSASPDDLETVTITGLGANQTLRGIDFRPATGDLVGSAVTTASVANSTVFTYSIDPTTGAATVIGQTAAAVALAGDVPYGFDFNPTVDRIRGVNTNDENFRLNPNDGTRADVANDTDLSPSAGTALIGAAYDRNFVHSGTTTTLFGINRADSTLVMIGSVDATPSSPNGGIVTSVGAMGFTLSGTNDAGFDIANGTGIAFAAMTDSADGLTRLYTINLTTGAATRVGLIGDGQSEARGLAVMAGDFKLVNATTATYVDEDGDRVTLKTTKGNLDSATFRVRASSLFGGQLAEVNFNEVPDFQGTGVTFSVKKSVVGDGLANVGFIDATALDLGAVTVKGDLGVIDAGNTTLPAAAIKSLTAQSMGLFGIATGAPDLSSNIMGAVGKLSIKTDVKAVLISVVGGSDGGIGPITIGGSLIGGTEDNSGRIFADSDIASIKIGGDVMGGAGLNSGSIFVSGADLGPVTVGGSVIGSSGTSSGRIAGANFASVKIMEDVRGGAGSTSGRVSTIGAALSIFIGGSVIGGEGGTSGTVNADDGVRSVTIGGSLFGGLGANSGKVNLNSGNAGSIRIGGDVVGANSASTGFIEVTGDLGSLTIGGSLVGGRTLVSGTVLVTGTLGPVRIGGSVFGGDLLSGESSYSRSGYIQAARIASVTIGGSIVAGIDNSAVGALTQNASIRAVNDLGPVKVGGNLLGSVGFGADVTPVVISARGQTTVAPGAKTDVAIASLTVGGSVHQALILAGYDTGLTATNPDAQIGKVSIGRDWVAGSIVAGIQDDATAALNTFFGDADDVVVAGGNAGIDSRIASIVIKGQVAGTAVPGDHFGFVAQEIASMMIGGRKLPLVLGFNTPLELSLPTGDVTVRRGF